MVELVNLTGYRRSLSLQAHQLPRKHAPTQIHETVQNRDSSPVLNVTYRTAQRNMAKLVEAGILQQVGDASYGRTFLAGKVLQVIEEGEA